MTDSIAVFDPGWRATDSSGAVISGAKIRFFDAGTTTPKLVYSNSDLDIPLGSTVTCNSAGYPTSDGTNPCAVFTGTAAYKVVIFQSDGVTQVPGASWDNLSGAVDTSGFMLTGSTSTLSTPVTTISANYSVLTGDRGKIFNVNVGGGNVTVTLPSAVAAGNGYTVCIRHDSIGSANTVGIGTTSGQTIKFRNEAPTTVSLTGCGEAVWLSSDGTGWTVDSYVPPIGINPAVLGMMPINSQITASVSGNALTVSLLSASTAAAATATTPVYLPFRNSSAASGAITWRTVTGAATITVPPSATLGTSSSTPFRLWVIAWDTGSGVVIGVINCFTSTGIIPLTTGATASATAISTGATSAGVHYAASATTSRPYAILGYLDWTGGLPTAGTWSGAPDVIANYNRAIPLPGTTIQTRPSQTGAAATTTTAIPNDDTIPQNTEGAQALTVDITPTGTANAFEVYLDLKISASTANTVGACALFQDSGANAIAAANGVISPGATGALTSLPVSYFARTAATAQTTFRGRYGLSAGTCTLNGTLGTRNLGGVLFSSLIVREIMG